MSRPRYVDDDDYAPPPGVSFLLCVLGAVALCIAAVYLRASTLHEREIKISAYEETISAWNASRPTFSRLSVNVTAHFGVAPPNTTSPGLDPDPPTHGPPLPLTVSEIPDPIYDEEGASGGLPNYEPLKLDRGVAPPPWRTAPRFPPPGEEEGDSQEDSEEASDGAAAGGDAAATGTEEQEEEEGEGQGTNAGSDAGADGGGGGRRRQRHRQRQRQRQRRQLEGSRWAEASWPPGPAASAFGGASAAAVAEEHEHEQEDGEEEEAGAKPASSWRQGGRSLGLDRARRVDAMEKQGSAAEAGGGEGLEEKEEKEEEEEEETLPPEFIPEVPFEDAPSVRFLFSARLEPAPPSRNNNSNGNRNKSRGGGGGVGGSSGGGGGGGRERRRLLPTRWRRRRRRRRNETAGAAGGGGTEGPIVAEMYTEWTPLTRIRKEHAPMPAPETKCMQVFGGVHNYKTKMCEVYERLSGVCVQVHVDDSKGEIRFSPVAEIGSGTSSSSSSSSGGGGGGGGGLGSGGASSADQEGEEEEEEDAAAAAAYRYGCDPRNAWSPWSYAVVTVAGRTVLDVVPPAVSFDETLLTVRSDLDPFLHVEALTYVPGSGGGGGGESVGAGDGGAPALPSEAGEAAAAGGGGNGGHFLTFGLSSWNCAVVGSAFLLVGLLLFLQPVLALRRWWRETGGAGGGGGGGGGSGGGIGGREGGGSARLRGKQWRYGQLETEWADGSEYSDAGAYDGDEGDVDDDGDSDGWGSEGDWQGGGTPTGNGVRMPASPAEGHQLTARSSRFMQDSLRRRADGGALGGGGRDDEGSGGGGGIQMGPMGRSLGVEAALV